MIICNPRSLAFRAADSGTARGICRWAAGGGGRGGAIGAEWVRQAWGVPAVGSGAPAGAVGGGPRRGAVGGGSPGSKQPGRQWSSWNGNPSRNAGGLPGNGTNASPGIINATTTGGVIGGGTGVPSAPAPAGVSRQPP